MPRMIISHGLGQYLNIKDANKTDLQLSLIKYL